MTRGFAQRAGRAAGLAVCIVAGVAAHAQTTTDEFPTGRAAAAWTKWQPAMQAVLDRKADQAEQLFGDLLGEEPSPFRVALLAERTTSRTGLGGALLLLKQDAENKSLGPNGQRVAELLDQGKEQMDEADDGWYFCSLGRFDVAQANFQALLGSNPDPVAVLEFTDQIRKRRDMLVQLAGDPVVGPSVQAILKLLDAGEEAIKADPTRIRTAIERLGGPPRAFENAVSMLKQSGEYAVPFIVEVLRDPARKDIEQAILRCLPQIGRPALDPLVIAVRMDNLLVRGFLVKALGEIGYPQAVPYLLQLREKGSAGAELTGVIEQALEKIRARSTDVDTTMPAAQAFYRLALAYYKDQPSLAADMRLETANVWYWRDGLLQNTVVPTHIFNEIMCMRCCEEALLLNRDMKPALALWVAADFRREAQLGEDDVDRTRPDNYPSAGYFAQTAGPEVCLMALAQALDDGDPAVALGAIEALRGTAGPANILDTAGRMPLAEALTFPDRMVRVRAALMLGNALPTRPFPSYQNLMPVLAEAVMLFGGARNALVIEPDAQNSNQIAATLRADEYQVVSDAAFLRGLQKVRESFPSIDVIFLASDVTDVPLPDALRQLRNEARFAATPVVLIAKPGQHESVRDLVRGDHRLAQIMPGDSQERIRSAVETVSRAVGVMAITPDIGTALALEAVETLRILAETNNPLFSVADAKAALIMAMASPDAVLRLAVAKVLVYLPDSAAQEAIAKIALDESQPEDMRVQMFEALANAARQTGNHLGAENVNRIVKIAEQEPNLVIRTAASRALGALNLPSNKGSEIIRNQYGG